VLLEVMWRENSPHEAFAIGGTNIVRGYKEPAVGSGALLCCRKCGEGIILHGKLLVSLPGLYVFMLFNWPHMSACDTSVSV
jgi:hypothetical protein